MVDDAYVHVLQTLLARFATTNVLWVITGGFSFALQGIDHEPNDIDVQSNRNGAYEIGRLLSEYVIQPVAFKTSENIRSHFGTASINGISLEIMGDIEKRDSGGQWIEPPDLAKHRRWIEFADMEVPVLSLEYEYEAYQALGRFDAAAKIKTWLELGGNRGARGISK